MYSTGRFRGNLRRYYCIFCPRTAKKAHSEALNNRRNALCHWLVVRLDKFKCHGLACIFRGWTFTNFLDEKEIRLEHFTQCNLMICGGEALTYVGKTQFNFNWRFSLLVVTDKRKIFTRGCINFSVNCVKNTGSICPFSCDKKRTSIIKFL